MSKYCVCVCVCVHQVLKYVYCVYRCLRASVCASVMSVRY